MAQQGPQISPHMVPMAPCGNTGHRHQHRPTVPVAVDYRPRGGPLSGSEGLDIIMAQVTAQVILTSMALATAWLLDINMVSSGRLDPRHPHIPEW